MDAIDTSFVKHFPALSNTGAIIMITSWKFEVHSLLKFFIWIPLEVISNSKEPFVKPKQLVKLG